MFHGSYFMLSAMQAGTTIIFGMTLVDGAPTGNRTHTIYQRLLESAGATEGLFATMELLQQFIKSLPPPIPYPHVVTNMTSLFTSICTQRLARCWTGEAMEEAETASQYEPNLYWRQMTNNRFKDCSYALNSYRKTTYLTRVRNKTNSNLLGGIKINVLITCLPVMTNHFCP